jgi:hypothetical protein
MFLDIYVETVLGAIKLKIRYSQPINAYMTNSLEIENATCQRSKNIELIIRPEK